MIKRFILVSILTITTNSILNAKEVVNINIFCSDSKIEKIVMKVNTNKLDLTEDAVQDNVGGYVDIPEDRYYLKTQNKVYHLDAVVQKNYEKLTNEFTSTIQNNSTKTISIKELYGLKNNDNLKLIQKINLQSSSQNSATTNTLDIYFEKILFEKDYQRCLNI